MSENFENLTFREFIAELSGKNKNVIKADKCNIIGKTKIDVDEDAFGGIKIVMKKDDSDNVKEIKFVCSCGQTKSVTLDYEE